MDPSRRRQAQQTHRVHRPPHLNGCETVIPSPYLLLKYCYIFDQLTLKTSPFRPGKPRTRNRLTVRLIKAILC